MKNAFLIVCLFAGWVINTSAQNSKLVYPGTDGKLVYDKYANQGEDTLVNIIPDFSYAGYLGGGVPLPENVPVKITLDPTGSENDSAMIQNAINQVSAMPLDENGFRGAVLLKAGLYKVDGKLTISASGVVLRGEKQLPAAQGGTELMATAERLHSFINIKGDVIQRGDDGLELGTEIASFDYPAQNVWIQADAMEGVSNELNDDSVITFVFYSITGGNFKFYSKENGDSSRIPYLEIIAFSEALSADDTLKIYPKDDTYVRGVEEYRETNYGDDNLVYYKKVDPEVARIGFVKFDLSEIPGTLKSAKLNLLASREDQSGVNYIAYTKDDNWSEDTRTWNTTFGDYEHKQRIVSKYVGTGSRIFVIEDASSYKAGDEIFVRRTPNQLWCDTLGMSKLSEIDPEATDWTPESYTIDHPRKITAIYGDTVWIDIPVVDPMQELYGGGEILKKTDSVSVNNSAVENMYISSVYKSETDENHGWDAIKTGDIENCWVRNVTARYFGYSCVDMGDNTNYCTIQDCALLDPKSLTEGGRKYPFPIHGGIGILVQRCYGRGGRHSFATHSRLTGPHVFLDCYATETYADIGPHHRWAAGILFDNVYGGQIRVQNRLVMGTGHGWAGVQNMFWNCYSYFEEFKVESPMGGLNWAIGCIAQKKEGAGYWESYGIPVQPRSLYLQQLSDRLGEQAVINITTEDQRNGNIWDQMADWAGNEPEGVNIYEMQSHSGEVRIYPNPAEGHFFVDLRELETTMFNIELFDLQGKCISNLEIFGGKTVRLNMPGQISNELLLIRISRENTSIIKKITIK
ncbi:DNRLRE domain-containing protein [Bacteroidota bacterium]